MGARSVAIVITDLDNTLYDWVGIWYASFSAMLESLVSESGIPRAQLISEIEAIHQRHKTSEYAFLIEEIPSLRAKHPGQDLTKVYSNAISRYREGRAKTLQLYPGVVDTLKQVRKAGTIVVGYTESMAFYTNYRLRRLGLDCLLDYVYSPEDHDLPANLDPDTIRLFPPTAYDLVHAEHRYTPKGSLKPSSKVLRKILDDLGVDRSQCIYVGDSLMKDVSMANDVGVISVHAAYGESHRREPYELLKEVTHWSPEDVAREKTFTAGIADYSLNTSFTELLDLFQFRSAKDVPMETQERQIKVWEKIVDVQMHFNELSLKVRGLAVAVLGAILTAAAFSLKDRLSVNIWDAEIPAAFPILLIALLTWIAFYVMDHLWYHRLLKGAVTEGLAVENLLSRDLKDTGLAHAIGRMSAITYSLGFMKVKMNSDARLRLFYGSGVVLILVLAYLVMVVDVAPRRTATTPTVGTVKGTPTAQPAKAPKDATQPKPPAEAPATPRTPGRSPTP